MLREIRDLLKRREERAPPLLMTSGRLEHHHGSSDPAEQMRLACSIKSTVDTREVRPDGSVRADVQCTECRRIFPRWHSRRILDAWLTQEREPFQVGPTWCDDCAPTVKT